MLRIWVILAVSLGWSLPSFADVFVREYTYQASDADSKITARQQALSQLKTLVLQEVGTSLHHVFTSQKNMDGLVSAKETLKLITAGVSKVNVLDERWTGTQFYIKAQVEVDTLQVLEALEQRQETTDRMKQQSDLLNQQRVDLKRLQNDMARLQQQIQRLPKKPEPLEKPVLPAVETPVPDSARNRFDNSKPTRENRVAPEMKERAVNDAAMFSDAAQDLIAHMLLIPDRINATSGADDIERLVLVNSTSNEVAVKLWQAGVLARKKMYFVTAGGQVIIDFRAETRKMTSDWYVQLGASNSPLKTLGSVMVWSDKDVWLVDISTLHW